MVRLVVVWLLLMPLPSLAAGIAGQDLFAAGGCRGCHRLNGEGGKLGPPLDRIGRRFDAARLRLSLVAPAALRAEPRMPAYNHLPQDEIDALVAYLAALK